MRKLIVMAAVLCVSVVTVASVGAATKGKTKSDSGTVFVGESHHVGSTLYEAGNFTSKVLGSGAALYTLKATGANGKVTVTAKHVTFYNGNGSLTGTGTATVTPTSATTATVTNGTFKLSHGTGALKGHSESGTFTGSGNPSTTEYVFHFTGTYK